MSKATDIKQDVNQEVTQSLPDARRVESVINRYYKDCVTQDVFPDEAGLILELSISKDVYNRMRGINSYNTLFERADLQRESWLARKMVSDPKVSSGCMAALKQNKNGGYLDRQVSDNSDKTFRVVMESNINKDDFA